jgi:chromosome segregation ATPase
VLSTSGAAAGGSFSQSVSSSRVRSATGKKKKGSSNSALRPVVRTIYLPNENIEILKQIIASLRAQLTEQHTLYEQRIQALQEDRSIREQEATEVQRKANQHMDELAKELKAVNELNKMTTRDYLELRHAAQQAERKLKERASDLSQQLHELQRHIKQVENKAAVRRSFRLCTGHEVICCSLSEFAFAFSNPRPN